MIHRTRTSKTFRGQALLAAAGLCAATIAPVAIAKGNPFQEIEEQIATVDARVAGIESSVVGLGASLDALTAVVNEQQFSSLPVTALVNCAAGESINSVLDQYSNNYARLTITVEGACSEAVIIVRDNVTIQGGAGASISTNDPNIGPINVSRGASHIEIRDITLSGGTGVLITRNSQVVMDNVDVTATVNGILVLDNAVVTAENSRLYGNTQGVVAQAGGQAVLANSIVEQNNVGLFASNNGIVQLTSRTIAGTIGQGTVVRNNATGFAGQSGGRLMLTDARFEQHPTGVAIYMHTSASAHFLRSANGQGNVISNNGIGVYALKNTSVLFTTTENTFSNNFTGINCLSPDTSYWTNGASLPGTFTNNFNGDVVGCTGF